MLAENGWHVALIDINAEGLASVEAELREAGHSDLLAVPTDIASESSVKEAFDRIDAALPPVVGLVNLAGIACPTPLHECDLKEFERVMAVNVSGSFLALRAAAPRMIQQGVGRIVNTSSITAFDGGGTFSKGVYATAKAAVIGMCKGAARELGPYGRSEEHTSELQSRQYLVCRLLLEKKINLDSKNAMSVLPLLGPTGYEQAGE